MNRKKTNEELSSHCAQRTRNGIKDTKRKEGRNEVLECKWVK